MPPERAIDYVKTKGLVFKKIAGQVILQTCPFCHDQKSHFYMSPEDGCYFCHKCQEKGNLLTLKKHMDDMDDTIRPAFSKSAFKIPTQDQAELYYGKILKDEEVIAYLKQRGINGESIERFKLGACEKDGIKWLSIPHFQNGELVNIKFRSLPPADKAFRRIPDCRSILFNTDVVKGSKEIFITEGELDAISLIQTGIKNTVAATNGAGAFDPEWIDQLKNVEKIYICYDPDDVGRKGARSLAKRLGYNRCFSIELPEGRDVNDFFLTGDIFDFKKLVNEAHKFDLPGVISIETGIDLLIRGKIEGEAPGLLTPWKNVNQLIKGFYPGDLIILTAPPKIGKTSFALNLSKDLALQECAVLFYCLEMRPERLVRKLIQAHYKIESPSLRDIEKARSELSNLPLYFAHTFKKEKLDEVLDLLREAIGRYDLKLIVFDNLHFLIRSIVNVNEELGQAVQGFKLLAEEMEIPIIVIAQPRKREAGKGDEVMCAEDVKYSNAIHADCDQMIILYRKRLVSKAKEIDQKSFTAKMEALDPVTLIRVEAHRYGSGGEALLYFHGEYSRFDELENRY